MFLKNNVQVLCPGNRRPNRNVSVIRMEGGDCCSSTVC